MIDDATSQPSGQQNEAFRALVAALEDLVSLGRTPTASEVYLEIRRETYGGFNLASLGYKKFRDFLRDAQSAGYIEIDSERPGDIGVLLPDSNMHFESQAPNIKADLWKAFIDWSSKKLRYYDLAKQHAIVIPREQGLLEPERFRELRDLVAAEPERFVQINPVGIKEQLAWMGGFAEGVTDGNLQSLLKIALESEKPAKIFVSVLKEAPVDYARWRAELSRKVREEIERWKNMDERLSGITIDRSADRVAAVERTIPNPGLAQERGEVRIRGILNELTRRELTSPVGSHRKLVVSDLSHRAGASSVEMLRASLHAAIDRMPIDELRSIRIPVGYMFED